MKNNNLIILALSLVIFTSLISLISAAEPIGNYTTITQYQKSIDYSCTQDSDCIVKDVHRCCGASLECTNKNALVDPNWVRTACRRTSGTSRCGIATVDSCKCEDNLCVGKQNNGNTVVGNDIDSQGCIPSAGYSWCEEKQKCLRSWEEACTESTNDTNTANAESTSCTTDSDCKLVIAGCPTCSDCKDKNLDSEDVIAVNKNLYKCPLEGFVSVHGCPACSGLINYDPTRDVLCVDNKCEKISNPNNLPGEGKVKILPETASLRARERLGELGFNITLKDVGKNNESKMVYEATAEKQGKFLGLFKVKGKVTAEIDAETGDIIKTHKPWWAFLASGI